MPVLLVRREEHGVAGAHLLDRAAPGLHQCHPLRDVNGLAEWMGMPGGAGAGLEAHPDSAQARGLRRVDDRVLPDRAGEIVGRGLARGGGAERLDFHGNSPSISAGTIRCCGSRRQEPAPAAAVMLCLVPAILSEESWETAIL